jgi:hypothetical protein
MSASLPLDILLKYKGQSKIFVETGTETGNTVQTAVDAGFDTIYSIDISTEWHQFALDRLKDYPQVTLLTGDSVSVLMELIPYLEYPTMFWLDAHEGHWTAGTPILEEIGAIRDLHRFPVTILADDMRLMGFQHWVDVTVDDIIEAVHEIDPLFKIILENNEHAEPRDLFVAYREDLL